MAQGSLAWPDPFSNPSRGGGHHLDLGGQVTKRNKFSIAKI